MFSLTGRVVCKRSSGWSGLAVRSFSASAAPPSDAAGHRPLVSIHGLHARYANAAYVAASKAGALEQVESELLGLQKAATDSKAFADFLMNPMISRDAKTKYVEGLDKVSDITRNLLVTMAGNARLNELPKVAATFTQFMKAKRGEVETKIITAEPLTQKQLKEIQAAMETQVPKGKSVVIKTVVDPSIVGGLQVQIGDQFLDLSVKSRIESFAKMPLS